MKYQQVKLYNSIINDLSTNKMLPNAVSRDINLHLGLFTKLQLDTLFCEVQ